MKFTKMISLYFCIFILGGCGNKGPLSLPSADKENTSMMSENIEQRSIGSNLSVTVVGLCPHSRMINGEY